MAAAVLAAAGVFSTLIGVDDDQDPPAEPPKRSAPAAFTGKVSHGEGLRLYR